MNGKDNATMICNATNDVIRNDDKPDDRDVDS